MVRSPSSSAGATARSRTACRSRRGGITRYVSSAREQKSSTARGRFRWHNPRVEAFDRHLKGIEACLKPSEPSEQKPESKSRPWFVAAASATARTVLILFAVGAATGAALLYVGT